MSLNELHTVMKSLTLPNQLMRPDLLVKEISPYQLARQCKSLPDDVKLIQAHRALALMDVSECRKVYAYMLQTITLK